MQQPATQRTRIGGAVLAAAFLALPVVGDRAAGQSGTAKKPSSSATAAAPATASLEEMLASALKYNPDIRVAEVRLRDDEADLNRTRLRVLQKIIALHHSLASLQAEVDGARARVKRLQDLVRRNAVQPSLLQEAEQDLARANSRLGEAQAEVPYLVGKPSAGLAQEVLRTDAQIIGPRRSAASTLRAATVARIHKALEATIRADYDAVPLGDLLKDLQGKAGGVVFQRNLALQDLYPVKVSLRLGEVPLGAALLALQDALPGLRVVVREYGILFTWEHQVPLGAVRLYDFWRNEDRKANP
jgi:hypothetical protein